MTMMKKMMNVVMEALKDTFAGAEDNRVYSVNAAAFDMFNTFAM